MSIRWIAAAGAALVVAAGAPWLAAPANAQPLPVQAELVVSGLATPVLVAAPKNDPRLFIVERGGTIRIFDETGLRATPFLDLGSQVSTSGAFGMFGLAFAPDYAQSGVFYVYYVNTDDESTISRFVTGPDPDVASGAEEVIFSLPQPFSDHNGGTVAIRPTDGHLYFAPGDGGGGPYDPGDRSQDPNSLFGKMIRLDVSGGPGVPAGIPGDNPFVGLAPLDEIWAFGLRNPFRFSFDRETGDLWIGDVGQEDLEEIDFEPASDPGGHDYGWDVMEGSLCIVPDGGWWDAVPCAPLPGKTLPLHEYGQSAGDCSITGGHVSRGAIPELYGLYVFGDWCSGRLFTLDPADPGAGASDHTPELAPGGVAVPWELVSFGEGGYGELYAIYLGGSVYRLRATGADADDDFAPDASDNCVGLWNPAQSDADGDGLGDACDVVCDDGLDNDFDGAVDWNGGPLGEPADAQCDGPFDQTEAQQRRCGGGVLLGMGLVWVLVRARGGRT